MLAAEAVSVTWVFGAKVAEHVVGQLMPAGALVTVPVFAVPMLTLSVNGVEEGLRTPVQPIRSPDQTSTKARPAEIFVFIKKQLEGAHRMTALAELVAASDIGFTSGTYCRFGLSRGEKGPNGRFQNAKLDF